MKDSERYTCIASCDGYEDIALRAGVTINDAVCQLAEYEKTGLTPQGVKALQAELKRLKAVKQMKKHVYKR